MVPARRGKNFRSGDLAEQLGLYLLQSMALVAPVPRTEDVGIDVVCTLISEYDQYSYLAEDSFYVQIKSDSIREIEYSDVEVQWLTNLKLPLFVAVVEDDFFNNPVGNIIICKSQKINFFRNFVIIIMECLNKALTKEECK